jgi:hypothetical protein
MLLKTEHEKMDKDRLLMRNVDSGKIYAVVKRLDGSPLIRDHNGRPQMTVVGWRDGKRYGPIRWVYFSKFELVTPRND